MIRRPYDSRRNPRFWGSGIVIFILIVIALGYIFSHGDARSQEAPAPAVAGSPVDVGGGTQVNPEEAPPPEENDAVPTDDLLATETVTVTASEAIRVPWGNWIAAYADLIADIIWPLLLGLLAVGIARMPKWFQDIWFTLRAEQLLTRAKDYGINATRGAAAGKALDLNVGSEAAAKAGQYAIDNGPEWLIKRLGGREGIRQKMLARIPLDEHASIDRGV